MAKLLQLFVGFGIYIQSVSLKKIRWCTTTDKIGKILWMLQVDLKVQIKASQVLTDASAYDMLHS